MRILNEGSSVSKTKNEKVLKIYSSKELMSKTFAKQFSRKMKESFLDSFYTNTPKGSFRRDNLGEELPSGTVSSYGLLQTRFYVFRYIDSVLEMGNNIATQSEVSVRMESGRQIPGSIAFVPSAAGLLLAAEVVKDLIK